MSLLREAMKDVVLVDGTVIPKGTMVCVPTFSIQHDAAKYPDPDMFDPFRFSRMREKGGNETKYQLSTTSPDWIGFGHGRQSWSASWWCDPVLELMVICVCSSSPGRFFAANELRAMLAYIVMNYDLKMEDGASRPKNFFFAVSMVPPQSRRILVRKRTAVS